MCRHNYDECNHAPIICSFVYSLYDAGKRTGITVSQYSSRVSGSQIGVGKGKEIAQEVCFIILVQLDRLPLGTNSTRFHVEITIIIFIYYYYLTIGGLGFGLGFGVWGFES